MPWTHPLEWQCGFAFLEASNPVKKNLKLPEVNLSYDDIFIVFNASTQQGANWLIDWAFV